VPPHGDALQCRAIRGLRHPPADRESDPRRLARIGSLPAVRPAAEAVRSPVSTAEKRTEPGATQVTGRTQAWNADQNADGLPPNDSESLRSLVAEPGLDEAQGAPRFSGTSAPS
jgi:hypothetical protein